MCIHIITNLVEIIESNGSHGPPDAGSDRLAGVPNKVGNREQGFRFLYKGGRVCSRDREIPADGDLLFVMLRVE